MDMDQSPKQPAPIAARLAVRFDYNLTRILKCSGGAAIALMWSVALFVRKDMLREIGVALAVWLIALIGIVLAASVRQFWLSRRAGPDYLCAILHQVPAADRQTYAERLSGTLKHKDALSRADVINAARCVAIDVRDAAAKAKDISVRETQIAVLCHPNAMPR
jgi:hypothetical protein